MFYRGRGVCVNFLKKKMVLYVKIMLWFYFLYDVIWIFWDEWIIGLVNVIYEGIFVYILVDVV